MTSKATIVEAIYNRIKNVKWNTVTNDAEIGFYNTDFKTACKVKLFSDTNQEKPALYLTSGKTSTIRTTNRPPKKSFPVTLIIYHDIGREDPEASGMLENIRIFEAIEAALEPLPIDNGFLDSRNTLGGIVYSCAIIGDSFEDSGDLDGQAMLIIPISVTLP